MSTTDKNLSPVEHIKIASNYLRGTIADGLADELTASIAEDDTQLTKFYGFYQQDDRDLRAERKTSKLEPHYQFMLRLRLPAGVVTGEQYLEIDRLADEYANGTLRLTTRQTFQYHHVAKKHLRPLLQDAYAIGIDARGACGDVNRNVMASAFPEKSAVHAALHDWSTKLSEHLAWKSRAYEEIFLQQQATGEADHEPIYGTTYLPRKFKIAIAVPPENDVDLFANDIGLIGIVDNDELVGFNVAIGGGMGTTHGEPATYPRLGSVIGFAPLDKVLETVETLVTIQRDYGDRENRKHARFKYTIDDHGIGFIHEQLAERANLHLDPARDYHFERNGDPIGWFVDDDGKHHVTLFIENGRIADFDDNGRAHHGQYMGPANYKLRTGLREIAKIHKGTIRLTGNHNVVVSGIEPADVDAIAEIVSHYGIDDGSTERNSALRHASMSCVAFPTCGLAMAESERYLPDLVGKIETLMQEAGLGDERIVVRMTGCPNGCARPFLGEIAFVGKAPGKYNMYLGAAFDGSRLNKLYRETIGEDEILAELAPMIERWAAEREPNEHFGDFVVRVGIIAATREGRDFHDDVGPAEAA
ncbi:NADPH-dependent assimilatory sulfite reductase hemoprotein subunit [Salinisphaera sp. Q1T1-3]|uniref:NADPH-dependent assimilatory sulfite reductase hemoprotein subunit n=1 Tax=Salinisphaera sp. Q1T1-3 TaxID=2321229 RepID=UPI000E73F24F|nr:NADPH-dependent assimilatory sulfite reductase hemoprotein subunit [Salinisphaera sp. Q1T1-3]RJS94338.1 NADPH-dependent assimilatory sulfite reductase hemoprotein subunit [Salinisphaera sp. Q1T1-3]